MSSEQSPVDHFSDEAINAYTALLCARQNAARQSIANRKLIEVAFEVLYYDTPHLVDYRSALGETTGLYIAGYRRLERTDDEIKALLIPRLVDEHRMFGKEEEEILRSYSGHPDMHSRLKTENEEDHGQVMEHAEEEAIHKPLDDAVWSVIHRVSRVIVTRSNAE